MRTFDNSRTHMPIFVLTVALLLLASLGTWTQAAAPAAAISDLLIASEGDLDPSFGTGGKVTADFFDHIETGSGLVLQPDGRIIVVGSTAVGSGLDNIQQSEFAILRYNSDGSPDNSFGNGGKVTTDFLGFPVGANAVALYPDGRIVVVGYVDYDKDEDSDFGIARYNSDGSLDTTFGNDGKVIAGLTRFNNRTHAFDNSAQAVAVQSDGKIVVAGFVGGGPNLDTGPDFGLIRYNVNGSPDTSFGTNGIALTDFFGSVDDARSLILQPDGKIIVVGDIVNLPANTNHDFGLARYNSDGTLDASFGSGGKVVTDFFRTADSAQAVALQANGKIVTAGYVYGGGIDYDFGLARYNPDGSLDRTFGTNGKINTDFSGREMAGAVTIQPDGKIIAGGFASPSPSPGFTRSFVALARYRSDGSLDSSFGVNGKVTVDFFGKRNAATALAMQPDGKLVVAGTAEKNENDYDLALLRLFAFTPPDFGLQLVAPTVQASRGEKVKINIGIARVGGFTGNVIVSVSDTSAFDIIVTPNPASTSESNIKFKLKIKGSTPVGTHDVTFTGKDDSGRERSATLGLIVQ
jgi:uncharacterized delta-60 repeat protein